MSGYDDGLDDFFGRRETTLVRDRPLDPTTRTNVTSALFDDATKARRRAARPTPPQARHGRANPSSRADRSARSRTGAQQPPARLRSGRQAASPTARSWTSRRGRAATTDFEPIDPQRQLHRRLGVALLAVLLAAAAMTAKLVDAQVLARHSWASYGQGQRDGYRTINAGRGAIYDREGNALALSVLQPDVVANPRLVETPGQTASKLAPLLKADRATLVRKLKAKSGYAVLATQVSTKVADQVAKLRLAGISTEDNYQRDNPSGALATSIIGRTVADGGVDEHGHQGLSGIEQQYDRSLTGTPGRLYYEHDPKGRTIAGGAESTVPAKPGTDVFLTIDQNYQYETERALTSQVSATGAASGMAVIMRPSTGEILSMASVGVGRDGKVTNTNDNRPVTAVFEPGSVNKMITVAGALEQGQVTPSTVLQVPDHLRLYDKDFTDHDPHPVRPWSVTDILVTSSNIGTIKIARQLGASKVDSYLRAFGLGKTTGLGFPNEEDGIMLPLDRWSGTSIGAIPIGQGIAVTALQMLAAYNTIANDGVYIAPRLVAATDAGHGRVASKAKPGHRVVSVKTARAMQEMLEKVVSDGTGKKARVPGYPVAGKTGTARIPQGVDPKDGYLGRDGRYHYQATFLGFVSGADLSIIVSLEDPKTSSYGGDVAAPVFSHLASYALIRSQTPPPSLSGRNNNDVPELSTTARAVKGEDAGTTVPGGAG